MPLKTLIHFKRRISIFAFIIGIFSFSASYSQDSIPYKTISFSTNVLQSMINELSLRTEWMINKRNRVGFDLGYVYPGNIWKINPTADPQGDFPGNLYHGTLIRAYEKLFFKSGKNYFAYQVVLKWISYSNQTFADEMEDGVYIDYLRSEKNFTYGFDLLFGYNPTFKNLPLINLDFFYGLGFRYRNRKVNTIDSYYSTDGSRLYGPSPPPQDPIGSFKVKQAYMVPVLGIRLGFNVKIKNKSS